MCVLQCSEVVCFSVADNLSVATQFRVDETTASQQGEHSRERSQSPAPGVISSTGFVKWINRRNVRRQFEKNRLRKTTNDCLSGKRGTETTKNKEMNNQQSNATLPTATTAQSMLSSDKSLLDTMRTDDEDDDNHHNTSPLHHREHSLRLSDVEAFATQQKSHRGGDEEWECIPRESHIELCSMIPDEFLPEEISMDEC